MQDSLAWAPGRSKNVMSSADMMGKFSHSALARLTGVYARLAFRSATRMIRRLPRALAARAMVSSVTETF
jgi:hypothetical protein